MVHVVLVVTGLPRSNSETIVLESSSAMNQSPENSCMSRASCLGPQWGTRGSCVGDQASTLCNFALGSEGKGRSTDELSVHRDL